MYFIFCRKYAFRGIHYAEEKRLGDTGTRYLMNVEFEDNIMETKIKVSEYMFYENQNRRLCFVDDFTWKRDAIVTIIAVIPNMETWSHYFMDHLSGVNISTCLLYVACRRSILIINIRSTIPI
jgi:hypothetical protein